MVKNLGVPIATLAMMLGVAAACGGGDTEGGLMVELGESGQRRSSEEVSAEATRRAARAQLNAEAEPSPTLKDPGPAPSPTRTEVGRAGGTPSAEPTPAEVTIPTGDDYDPELNMYRYLSGGRTPRGDDRPGAGGRRRERRPNPGSRHHRGHALSGQQCPCRPVDDRPVRT